MKRSGHLGLVSAGMLLLCAGAGAAAPPPPETSLNTCQAKVGLEGKKFVQNTVNAVRVCLSAVATDVLKKNVVISPGTAATCVAQFRKINDTRVPPANKSYKQKFKDNVDQKCVPGITPNVTHTFADIMGAGGGTLEDIKTTNIETWCKHFGGGGTIASVSDWENCITGSHNCDAAVAIAAQFPRAAEWVAALVTPMGLVPSPGTDPTRTSDALGGLALMTGLIDPDGDLISNPTCGGAAVACTTACCYVEDTPPSAPQTSCFEYTGPAVAIGAFLGSCGGVSLPGGPGFQLRTAIAAPCVVGPTFGTACAGPPNKVTIPTDTSCP
jgi:hypothetical protein